MDSVRGVITISHFTAPHSGRAPTGPKVRDRDFSAREWPNIGGRVFSNCLGAQAEHQRARALTVRIASPATCAHVGACRGGTPLD